jgi:hypothetical protein
VCQKRALKQHADCRVASSKAWAHMVLHLPHAEGGFGVTFNDVTKDAAFYTTTSRFVAWLGAFSQDRQGLWLPKDDLQECTRNRSHFHFIRHNKMKSEKEECWNLSPNPPTSVKETLTSFNFRS